MDSLVKSKSIAANVVQRRTFGWKTKWKRRLEEEGIRKYKNQKLVLYYDRCASGARVSRDAVQKFKFELRKSTPSTQNKMLQARKAAYCLKGGFRLMLKKE